VDDPGQRPPLITAATARHVAVRAALFTACASLTMGAHCAVTGYPPIPTGVAAVVGLVFGLVNLVPLGVEQLARRRAPSPGRDALAALVAGALAYVVEFGAMVQAAYAGGVARSGSLEAGQLEAMRQASQLPGTAGQLAVIFGGAGVMYGVAGWNALRPLRSTARDALLVGGVGAAAEAAILGASGFWTQWPQDARLSVLLVGGGGVMYAVARRVA
jgi:hypothetical protein